MPYYGPSGGSSGGGGVTSAQQVDLNKIDENTPDVGGLTDAGQIVLFEGRQWIREDGLASTMPASLPTTGWREYSPEGSSDNLFSADLTTTQARSHTLDHNFVIGKSNANDNLTFEMELQSFGQFGLDARDYAADQNTVVSRSVFNLHGGAISMRFVGDSKLSINGSTGLPRQRVSSSGGAGDDAPGYQNPSIVEAVGSFDFNVDAPELNLANFGNYYWNNTATAQYPVGLYSVVSSFNTASGFDLSPETAPAVAFGGKTYQIFNGVLSEFGGSSSANLWAPSSPGGNYRADDLITLGAHSVTVDLAANEMMSYRFLSSPAVGAVTINNPNGDILGPDGVVLTGLPSDIGIYTLVSDGTDYRLYPQADVTINNAGGGVTPSTKDYSNTIAA